jgi:predicted PurR-regulated permease PerM
LNPACLAALTSPTHSITKGADLPMLLMFSGVIGGLLAFGLIGIFVGPVVLAISYTLLGAWIAAAPAPLHDALDQEPPVPAATER